METPQVTLRSWLSILALGIIWGSTFMMIDIALRGITPFWLAAARITIAAGVMLAIWQSVGRPLFSAPVALGTWRNLVLIGVLSSAVPFTLLAFGLQTVSTGFAGVAMASVALMVLPLSHFFVAGERMTPLKAGGMGLGFCGVVLLIGTDALSSTGQDGELWGRLACLASAACYAVSSVLMRRLPPVDPVGLSTVTLAIGAACSVPIAVAMETPPASVPATPLIAIIVLGLIPTALANLIRVRVVRTAGPVFMSLVSYQLPLWSVFFGAVILSEPLPGGLLGAMALILSGMALSQWKSLRRLFVAVL